MSLKEVFEYIEKDKDRLLKELADLCRIPSISAHKKGQPQAAAAVRKLLEEAGAQSKEIPTDGGPNVVFGEMTSPKPSGTILMYNHYDVQPVDPIDLWQTDPFEPVVKDDRFYARGAGDTKGNIVAQIAAVRAFLEVEGRLPVNLKFVIEGEEEVGSRHFRSFVEANRETLKADGCTIEGGDHTVTGRIQVQLGCKGTQYVELVARTAKVDQHSSWAPLVPNAAWRLIHALNTMRDEEGRVLIKGFTEGARKPTPKEISYMRKNSFNPRDLRDAFGTTEILGGLDKYKALHRLLYTPTCTICGFWSGYTGEGSKTVNPAEARAKIDFRLVPGQKADVALQKVKKHLKSKGFRDIGVINLDSLEASATSIDARISRAVIEAAKDAYGMGPDVWPWSQGASAHYFFNEIVHVPSVSGPGVGYDGSNYHAPNEHIRIRDFLNASKHFAAMMARF